MTVEAIFGDPDLFISRTDQHPDQVLTKASNPSPYSNPNPNSNSNSNSQPQLEPQLQPQPQPYPQPGEPHLVLR